MTPDQDTRRFGPLDEMTPEQRHVVDAILSGPRGTQGGLQGPFEALLRSPDLADRVQRVGELLRFQSSLPSRLNEMAILLTARKWSAQFEWYAHEKLASAAGLDQGVIEAIADRATPSGLDEDARAVYRFASELLDVGSVTDDAFSDVRERFGEQGAIELVGIIGYYCLVSFVLNVDRYPVPGGVLPLSWPRFVR